MNYSGIIIVFFAFLITGIFHPVVIKCEYYFSEKIWPVFLIASLVCLIPSLMIEDTDFSTDILVYIANDEEELQELRKNTASDGSPDISIFLNYEEAVNQRIETYFESFTTKDIGDIGEGLVHLDNSQ